MIMWMTVLLAALVLVFVGFFVVSVRASVDIFPVTVRDEQYTDDKTDRSADLDSSENRDRFADLGEVEVRFGEEERTDHRNTANKVTDSDDETRCEAVEPLVCSVKSIRSSNRPAVARLDSVYCAERCRPEQEPKFVEVQHLIIGYLDLWIYWFLLSGNSIVRGHRRLDASGSVNRLESTSGRL